MTTYGRPDEALAVGVEANRKALLERNPRLNPLDAHREAIRLAVADNPTILAAYRSYGKEGR